MARRRKLNSSPLLKMRPLEEDARDMICFQQTVEGSHATIIQYIFSLAPQRQANTFNWPNID